MLPPEIEAPSPPPVHGYPSVSKRWMQTTWSLNLRKASFPLCWVGWLFVAPSANHHVEPEHAQVHTYPIDRFLTIHSADASYRFGGTGVPAKQPGWSMDPSIHILPGEEEEVKEEKKKWIEMVPQTPRGKGGLGCWMLDVDPDGDIKHRAVSVSTISVSAVD